MFRKQKEEGVSFIAILPSKDKNADNSIFPWCFILNLLEVPLHVMIFALVKTGDG